MDVRKEQNHRLRGGVQEDPGTTELTSRRLGTIKADGAFSQKSLWSHFITDYTRSEKFPYWEKNSHIGPNMGVQYGCAPILEGPIWESPIWVLFVPIWESTPILDPIWESTPILDPIWDCFVKILFALSRMCQYGIFISNMGSFLFVDISNVAVDILLYHWMTLYYQSM